MFQIPPHVPDISELSVRSLWILGIILYKIIRINNLTHQRILSSRIESLNALLGQIRDDSLRGEEWKMAEVQNYINYCCYTIWIPSVAIFSEEIFNLEHAEAVVFTWRKHQDDVHDVLHYIFLVLTLIRNSYFKRDFGIDD